MPKLRLLACLCALTSAAWTATIVDIVGQVNQTSYTDYLTNHLYTHDGNNRAIAGADHGDAQTAILNTFASFGTGAHLESFTHDGIPCANVVWTLPGLTNPDRIWIVGAHYDSYNNPGADDDASGVAAVLEAARVLSQFRFADTITFVAFDAEEHGLVGSYRYAATHTTDNVLGMISLDMISWGTNAAWVGDYNQPGHTLETRLAAAVTQYSGGITAQVRSTAFGGSDHVPFDLHPGWEGALLIEANYGSNPNYHKTTDSVDTAGYINYAYATGMTRGAVGFLAGSADTDIPEPATAALAMLGLMAALTAATRRSAHRSGAAGSAHSDD